MPQMPINDYDGVPVCDATVAISSGVGISRFPEGSRVSQLCARLEK